MRRVHFLFVSALALASAVILADSSQFIREDGWSSLLILSLLIAASSNLRFTELSGGSLDFTASSSILVFLIAGPSMAFWALAIGTVAESLLKSGQLLSLVFNLGQTVTTCWVAFSVFHVVGGAWGPAFDHPLQALAASVVYMLVNALLYAIYLHVAGHMDARKALRVMLDQASVRAYMITMAVGILAGFAYAKGGTGWAAMVGALAFLLHSTLKRYFDAVADARSQTQQLEIVLNATRGALIMSDRNGVIQVANRQVGVFFGANPEEIIGQALVEVPKLHYIQSQIERSGEAVEQVLEAVGGPARFLHWYRGGVHNLQGELQGYIQVFSDVTALKEAEENLRQLYDSTIRTLTAAIDARDSYTHGHSARVSAYAVVIAQEMGLSAKDVDRIRYSGLLHDIGKLGVDDQVLRKTGSLTDEERAMMMQHPVIGAEVLQKADMLTDLIPGVRWHHEWLSGGGYPDGLKGDQIPLDARIMCVADSLDAMTSDRPYRKALSLDEALRRVRENEGIQFDPAAAQALIRAVASGAFHLGQSEAGDHTAALVSAADREPLAQPRQLAVLHQLSREDNSSQNERDTLHRYLRALRETLGRHAYWIFLTEAGAEGLECLAVEGAPSEYALGKDRRLVHQAYETGRAVVVSNVTSLPGYDPVCADTVAEAAIPLGTGEHLIGVLAVEAGTAEAFGPDELYLLETIAHRLGGALKAARSVRHRRAVAE